MKERLMTLPEAAITLNLSPTTLRIQAEKGVLRADKLGRDWVVYASEVQRYAKEHKREALNVG
jgi:excisionase family DNA binding protein